MFEATYQEVNKRDEVVTKRKSFKTAAAPASSGRLSG